MESLVLWYKSTIGAYISREIFSFFISMLPLVELRGGLIVSSLLDIPLIEANILCIIGNIIPIPFILLFIKHIFAFLKKNSILNSFIDFLEKRAERKSAGKERGEFIFLLLFVGIPIPGTGAWMGALIAALMDFDLKKASIAIFLGLLLACFIMNIFSYGILANIFI